MTNYGLSYGVQGGDGGAPGGVPGVGSTPALSLEDIERNELALKAEVFSKIERVDLNGTGADGATSAGASTSVGKGISAEHLFVQLRNLGHDVTRDFVNDVFHEITKNSGQTSIELPDFLKFLDDPTYAPDADDDAKAAGGASGGASPPGSSLDVKYPASSPPGASTSGGGGAGAGAVPGTPNPAAAVEQKKKEDMERKLNYPMAADALESAYRQLQSAHPQHDGLTVADFDAAFRMTRENPEPHLGILSAIKPPTQQELTDLLKQMDQFSPDVILRDSLARFVLLNDNFTVPQPLFLTVPQVPTGATSGQIMTPMPGTVNAVAGSGAAGMAGGAGAPQIMLNAGTILR